MTAVAAEEQGCAAALEAAAVAVEAEAAMEWAAAAAQWEAAAAEREETGKVPAHLTTEGKSIRPPPIYISPPLALSALSREFLSL